MYISFSNTIVNYITYILWLFLKFRAKLDIVLVTAQNSKHPQILATTPYCGEQQISRECSTCWLSGRVLVSRSRGFGFESHWRHCVVSLSKTHYSLLSGASQEDQSRHNLTSWLGRKESKQTEISKQLGETGASSASGHVRHVAILDMGLGNIFGNYLWQFYLHEYTMVALLMGT